MNPSPLLSAPGVVAVPVDQPALTVLLRDAESGVVLAREPVRKEDLLSHMTEAWREGCLRQRHPGLPMTRLPMRVRPVPKSEQESACNGFFLETTLPDGRTHPTAFSVFSLGPVAARAAQRLVRLGKLHEDQTYHYEVHFQAKTPMPEAAPENRADFESNDRSPGLSWMETPLRPLLKQGIAQDEADGDQFHVFFTTQAWQRAELYARKGAAAVPAVETGAVLLGSACSCPETGDFFVVVTDAYEVLGAEQKVFSLAYTDQSWTRIQRVLKARQQVCPALRLVGQAHGHNFLPANGKTCEACPTRPVCDLTNVYASEDDETWTRAIFSGAPYALCVIFGLSARGDRVHGLFTQRDARLRRRGYFVIPEFNPEQWNCRSLATPTTTHHEQI